MAERKADEDEVRRQLERLVDAVRAGDLQGLRGVYAPDIVSFDVEPPLQHVGLDAKLENWERVFSTFQPPVGYEFRDLQITVGGEVAFAHGFARLSGTLRNGASTTGFWVRATTALRRVDGAWRVVHDHVSAPLEVTSGRALLDLQP